VRFGVGLSPYELYQNFDNAARAALGDKLAFLDDLGVRDLAMLFDDMRGDLPDLAHRQVEIVDWIAARTRADRMIVCPTYYSDDPVLDRVFGRARTATSRSSARSWTRPSRSSGRARRWCRGRSRSAHIERVTEQLRRKPFLWDNYPVNDGQRMSQYLHLRGFTGRPAGLRGSSRGARRQSRAPADADAHPRSHARRELSPRCGLSVRRRDAAGGDRSGPRRELGARVRDDTLILQDVGLDRLGDKESLLRQHYEGVDHPGAREIIDWLDGGYRITDEIVHTQ
jgi:hyaluronoglucosaminidase